jgi:hypothetical protein
MGAVEYPNPVGFQLLQWDGCRPWTFNSVVTSALAVQHLCAFESTVQMNSSSWCGRMLQTEWSHDFVSRKLMEMPGHQIVRIQTNKIK